MADTPDLCDFYLGSIVTRGPLKVAISTNGQSPTFAKRFRQWLETNLPKEEAPQLMDNLKIFSLCAVPAGIGSLLADARTIRQYDAGNGLADGK